MFPFLKKIADRLKFGKAETNTAISKVADPELKEVARRDVSDVLLYLKSSPDGISDNEASSRRVREGLNEIASEKPPHWLVQLLHAFNVPFNYLLLILALISFITEDYRAAVVITLMVILSGSLRFWQEYRSNIAAEKLRALVRTTATVSRPYFPGDSLPEIATPESKPRTTGSSREEVPIRDLVPGDVVYLSAGDLIPADIRILSAKDLFVSQSSLTGESLPVEKIDLPGAEAQRLLDTSTSLLELPNVCFMGTSVVSGTARAVVVVTGDRTYLGSLAKHLVGKRVETAFDKGVRGVSWLLIRFMLVMVPVVILLNGFTQT